MGTSNNLKTLNKNIGNLRNLNQTGYYWVKRTAGAEWAIGFYQAHLKKWSYVGVDKAIEFLPPAIVNWNKVGMFEGKISKGKAIYNALNELELNASFVRDELITLLWGEADYYIGRSFSVMFVQARKKIQEEDIAAGKEPRNFKSRVGTIERTE